MFRESFCFCLRGDEAGRLGNFAATAGFCKWRTLKTDRGKKALVQRRQFASTTLAEKEMAKS
jgi:hypothetical protein